MPDQLVALTATLPREAVVELPIHVARALRMPEKIGSREALIAVATWLRARGQVSRVTDHADRIVYQCFLGPFLGFRRQMGSFLSLLCHLPALVQDFQMNTLLLLPIVQRGRVRPKGSTPSPFAVADHVSIDRDVVGLPASHAPNETWRTVVDVCHFAGVSVGTILPLATIAMDAPRIAETPDLVYWWRSEPDRILTGTPVGHDGATWKVSAVPAVKATDCFVASPTSESVASVELADGNRLFIASDAVGERLSIANAYPDPVVGDHATYAWEDVAGIRFDDSYVPTPYDTWRESINPTAQEFLDEVLQHPIHRDTVVLIDVGEHVPSQSVAQASSGRQEFLIAEELWRFTAPEPYSMVTGPLIPCVAAHWRKPDVLATSLEYHLRLLAETEDVKAFLAGAANHDSVQVNLRVTMALLVVFWLLPDGVPFIFSGTEHGNMVATNREFGFADPDDRVQPLLLFNQRAIETDETNRDLFAAFARDLLKIRRTLRNASGHVKRRLKDVERDGLLVKAAIGDQTIVINCDAERSLDLRVSTGVRVVHHEAGAFVAPSQFSLLPRSTVVMDRSEALADVKLSVFSLDRA